MPNGINKDSAENCPPGGRPSADSSVARNPQIVMMAVAIAAAIGGLIGALCGSKLAR